MSERDAIGKVFKYLHKEENQLNSVKHLLKTAVGNIEEIEEEIESIEEKRESTDLDYIQISDQQEAVGEHMKELESKISKAEGMLEKVLREAGTDREALKKAS